MDRKYAEFLRERDANPRAFGPGDAGFSGWLMRQSMAEFRAATEREILLELTADLLATEFALGDGTHVTWGEATVDQHHQRYDMLLGQAAGSVEAAKRHMAAVRLLDQHHATTLGEVASRQPVAA